MQTDIYIFFNVTPFEYQNWDGPILCEEKYLVRRELCQWQDRGGQTRGRHSLSHLPATCLPPSTPGVTPLSTPGVTPHSAPGVTPPSTPGVTPPSAPGVTPPSTPGVTPPSTPGVTPPSTPRVTFKRTAVVPWSSSTHQTPPPDLGSLLEQTH
uniref:Uncharacterized protein n=1 Tax=Esox lucius TaxID=8010 RepID=A0AAY5KC54_ESOLU